MAANLPNYITKRIKFNWKKLIAVFAYGENAI